MKFLFLDFDGVLNSTQYLKSKSFTEETKGLTDAELYLTKYSYMLDPEMIRLVNDLVQRSGATVIASTSHRNRYSIDELNQMLESRGATFQISGKTPKVLPEKFSQSVPRGLEIQAFLDELDEPAEAFVILDDHYDMAHLRNWLVLTAAAVGLKPNQVEKALRILNGE